MKHHEGHQSDWMPWARRVDAKINELIRVVNKLDIESLPLAKQKKVKKIIALRAQLKQLELEFK